jgi:hypothetical protein
VTAIVLEEIGVRVSVTVRISILKQALLSPLLDMIVRLIFFAVGLGDLRQLIKLVDDRTVMFERAFTRVVFVVTIAVAVALTVLLVQLHS